MKPQSIVGIRPKSSPFNAAVAGAKRAPANAQIRAGILTLALEGGKTYAWCFDGKTAVFDQAFCELTNRSQNVLEIGLCFGRIRS
uniref:hypothetical protein n=1 Tax=Bilophila wadsworthia TaxID=35833 RepID=UPI003AB86986